MLFHRLDFENRHETKLKNISHTDYQKELVYVKVYLLDDKPRKLYQYCRIVTRCHIFILISVLKNTFTVPIG